MSTADAGIAAAVILVLALLAYRLLRRESRVWRTRYGIFVERERHEEHSEEPEVPGDETREWPRRNSVDP